MYEHHAKYYETDQMGIIHHSNYIRWMEEARIEFLKEKGISYRTMEEMGIISPVLSVGCEYKNMTKFDDVILIDVKVAKFDGVRLELEYIMTEKETGTLRAVGRSGHCFMKGDRIISLKKTYPEIYERMQAE